MRDWSHLAGARVIRLNASLHANDYEFEVYKEYDLHPVFCEPYYPDEIIPYVEECDALFAVSVNLPTPVIESLKRCKVISRLGTGTDKIDVATATKMGIVVTNVPYFCVQEQADHTMMLLLALERKLPRMMNSVATGTWNQAKRASGNSTYRLSERTLGWWALAIRRAKPHGAHAVLGCAYSPHGATRRPPAQKQMRWVSRW